MSNLLTQLWDRSPKSLYEQAHRKFMPGSRFRFPEPAWHTVKSGALAGASLFVAPTASDTWAAMVEGTLDAGLIERLQKECELTGRTVWDVGAHVGFHSLTLASLVGQGGRVVSYEPNKFNRQRFQGHLERNPELAKRIRLEPLAMADRAGELTFRVAEFIESGESSGSHLTAAQQPGEMHHYHRFAVETVQAVSADELVFQRQFPVPHVMKIDVEGAESLVLKGAARLLREHRPLLLIEVHHILEMFEVQRSLDAAGYGIEILDRDHASASRCFILCRSVAGAASKSST